MPDHSQAPRTPPKLSETAAGGLFDLALEKDAAVRDGERDDFTGAVIGRYRLISLLGEGGFGAVWRAEQTEPIRRELALKLIKPGMGSREIIARFEAESQALAMMDHPNIAAVLDAGACGDGRPYFVMELVHGEPLTRYCDSRGLPVRERLELFIDVCHAVQHAHQKAILHRDLKPSNILVTEVDGGPVPKVIDFGIAKALGAPQEVSWQDSLLRTGDGSVVGTLQYMSPEQAGSMPDVDTRSDIYSLGVILYELLTGEIPLPLKDTLAYDEVLRRIRLEEAVKPSARAGTSVLKRALRGDLDWIILKALEKDRRRRYESAAALAADLSRHLRREPVTAAAPTWRYRMAKFTLRNRAALIPAALVTAALLAGTGVSLWQAKEARTERARAEQNRAEAEKNLRRARGAVDQFLSKVTDNPRLQEADFQKLRKELLETAVPFYQEMSAAGASGDAGFRAERAGSLWRLANLYQETGEGAKAATANRQAIEILEGLTAEHPEEEYYQRGLMQCLNNLCLVYRGLGETAQSLTMQRRAAELAERMAARRLENPELRREHSTILMNLSFALSSDQQNAEAEEAIRRALEIAQALVNEAPDDIHFLSQLGVCQSVMASAHYKEGRMEIAEKTFREAVTTQERVAREQPKNPGAGSVLANTLHNFGRMLWQGKKPEEALRAQERNVEINTRLAADFPLVRNYRAARATGLYTLSDTLLQTGRAGEAENHLKEAVSILRGIRLEHSARAEDFHLEGLILEVLARIAHQGKRWREAADFQREGIACQREALRLKPGHDPYLRALRSQWEKLAQTLLESGDPAGAAETAAQVAGVYPDNSDDHVRAAELLAAAVARAVPEQFGEPREQTRGWALQAVELLKRAAELGWTDLAEAREKEAFAALRGFPAFMEMEEPPADPAGRGPARFTFDYPHNDPGKRRWEQSGETWTETQPSGVVNTYKISQRRRAGGVSGTEIVREGANKMKLFIPDKGSGNQMRLMMGKKSGGWAPLGVMTDVE